MSERFCHVTSSVSLTSHSGAFSSDACEGPWLVQQDREVFGERVELLADPQPQLWRFILSE